MKKIYVYYIMLLATVLAFTACNKEWEDELFEQSVSFAKNGVYSTYVKYKSDGNVSYQLPVIISGSTNNDRNLHVRIGLDPDTLETLNFERFRFRDDLYYCSWPKNIIRFRKWQSIFRQVLILRC